MESLYDPNALDDVEIVVLSAVDGNGYTARLRLPDEEVAFTRLPILPSQDLEGISDPDAYGEHLFSWLFQGDVAKQFKYARTLLSEPSRGFKSGVRFRLHLSLDPTSATLHRLLWESLYTPDGKLPFSLTTAFSRFMHVVAPHNLPVRKRPLRMLLLVSSSEGAERFASHEFDPKQETGVIEDVMRTVGSLLQLDVRESLPLAQIQDIEIKAAKADGDGYHIVHLLAPATFHHDQGYLLLPDDTGQAREVPVDEVARAIAPRDYPPRLVFLSVPLTAQRRESAALMHLAQMLIKAGVQALIVIQPPTSPSTSNRFIERFYSALMRNGIIDIAMAEARNAIYNPASWEWMHPVLYMRTPDGRLFQPLPETLESEIKKIKIERVE